MIELRDKDKNRVAGLVDYENLCIESVLDSGDKTLSFYYPKKGKYYDEIVEESYIRTKKDEFVVKARELDEDYTKFECSLNLEELEGNIFDRFESVEQTITSALNLAIVGTGWTVKDNTLKKRRTVRCTNKSSLEIVREIKKVYRVDIVFNTLGKQIEIYEHLGEDKGTYFIDSLNLIALQVQSDSRQYATRIIAEGKDGLSFSDINNGKNYVENYQYSNKVKTIYWKDERYSVKENLLEDARAKLEELSKPFRSYSASILNLAELNPRYSSILDFKLGDAINLISKKNKIKDKQRIVKTIEWPQDHTKDSVELANATLKFEDIQQENQETTSTVNNITVDDGTIDGSTIDGIKVKQIEDFKANVVEVVNLKAINASIDNLHANKADIQDLHAVTAKIGTLEANKANITQLNATNAEISKLNAIKANITDLNAANGKISILESKTASIDNLLAGNLTANNFKANSIVAGSGIIADGAIGSAQISSLSVNKLEAGDITTSKHRIVSADGTIEIVGNQILINRNNVNRVVLGEYRKKDGTTEYGLLVRAKDGQTVMLDGNGVHNAGITDGAIDNNKVADNANISGNKLDINSVIREVNTHGTETIAGTRIQVGDRTLDIELSTQKNTITEHSKELSSQKATIQALDNAIKLKVDSQTFTQSTTTINNNINRAKEEAINSANNAKAFVNAEITTVNSHLNKATAEINVLKKQIELKVGQSDVDKSIEDVKFGGRNLWLNTAFLNGTNHFGFYGCENINVINIENEDYKAVEFVSNNLNGGIYQRNGGNNQKIIPFEKGENLIISGYFKCSSTAKLRISLEGSSYGKSFTPKASNEWTYFELKAVGDGIVHTFTLYGSNNNKYTIRQIKVEKGTKATDWTKAPEDTDQLIVDNIKTVTDKITTVESKFTQENNSIKASVQDLNSTTQSITTNVSNINRDLTSKINSNLDAAKNFATDIATNKANTAKQEAINNAKAYTNAEITTVNSKVHNVESNLNILSDRINTKVSQSDIDKAVTTIRTERIIYARGTGNDYPANSIVKVNGKTISDGQGRGLRINALNKATLERVFLQDYDTFGSEDAKVSFVNKINELNNGDFIIIITSQDASYPLHQPIKEALEKIGATLFDNKQGTYREAYALIGKSKLGRGNGVEMFIPRTANDKRFAEVSVKVGEDGTFIGVNSNNMGLEATLIKSNISDVSSSVTQLRDSVTTDIRAINSKTQSIETTLNGKASKQEVTEVNNRVANIKASLDGITQRVSATESKTQTLEININGKASKEEIVSINSKVASIETSLSGITNRVSSTESKTSSLEVSINSTNSELNILKNSISTKLEKIDSHIKYGSTNLLINTEFLNNFYNWNKNQYVGLDKYQEKDYVGVMIQNNRIGTEGTLWQRATLKTEVTYTLSFEEYTDDISRWWVGIYYKLNGATKYITLFDSSVNKHSWQKRVFQFKLPSGATETDVSFYNYGGSVGRVWVCNLQLEEGEFATPYKSNPLDFSKFSSAITQTVEGINTEVSKKVNGRDIISTINQSAESVKINASRINLQGYVTVGDLGSTNVTTINNAHITSGTIEGRTMIALNGTGKQNGVLTVNNGESYLEYFRCREAWMMSPYANGWRVPLVHSKYGIKDNESSSDMIDEIAFYRGTDGRNYLQITNTKTGRVEYIELYRSAFDTVTILNRLDRIDAKLAGL